MSSSGKPEENKKMCIDLCFRLDFLLLHKILSLPSQQEAHTKHTKLRLVLMFLYSNTFRGHRINESFTHNLIDVYHQIKGKVLHYGEMGKGKKMRA